MSSNGTSAAYAPRRARRGGAEPEQRTVVAARPERGHEMHLIPARGPKLEKHLLEAAEFDALALPVGDDGVVIGTDQASRPAVISLFKPRAMDAALVGGAYMAQLVALRATATGARVVVETARPQLWAPLAQNAGGGQQVIAVVPVRRVGNLGATPASPVLLLRDCGARPPRSAAPKTPWMTTLTLLPFLDPSFAGHLISSDYVALQQISPRKRNWRPVCSASAPKTSPPSRPCCPNWPCGPRGTDGSTCTRPRPTTSRPSSARRGEWTDGCGRADGRSIGCSFGWPRLRLSRSAYKPA